MWLAIAGAIVLSACGGGGSSGPPKDLSLSGLKIPTSQVVAAISTMCAVAKQAHTDPVGSNNAFYGTGPHDAMHQLAAILNGSHATESKRLLDAMLVYEGDLRATPPPASTGADADALLQTADAGLRVLKVVPPTCP
jgi:hypothetical protein